jgi:hypothetical protein
MWLWTRDVLQALTPARMPQLLSGEGNELWAYGFAPTYDSYFSLYGATPGAGLLWQREDPSLSTTGFLQAPVQGRPGWAVNAEGVVDMSRSDRFNTYATVASHPPNSAGNPTPATTASLVRTREGELLVATRGDTVSAAGRPDAGVPFNFFEPKLAPEPSSRVVSSVMLPPIPLPTDGGTAPVASGYMLTTNGVFRIIALSEHRWLSEPLSVPYFQADPLEVWVDGTRGRLGHRDGIVYSLPSGVPISSRLPNNEQVRDYAELCGQGVALTTVGTLYRLVPGTGGLGVWQLESIPGFANKETELFSSKLYSNGNELYVMGTYGTVVKLSIAGGCR